MCFHNFSSFFYLVLHIIWTLFSPSEIISLVAPLPLKAENSCKCNVMVCAHCFWCFCCYWFNKWQFNSIQLQMLMYACFWLAVVDTSKAGQGDLDVHVSCNNVRVPCQLQLAPDGSRHNCSFIPASAQQHSVHVTYNKEPVPGKYTWNIVHVPVYNIVLYCIYTFI